MNTLTHVGNLFAFIGGLGMFLYGMDIMASGLQKAAGNKMRDLLGYLTNNRFLGVLIGALVTAIIQSSSATTVMIVGFVNAGIMNLTQAAGVIMGANVGTTATAWLVSANEWAGALKPDFFAPFILGIGAFIITFSNKKNLTEKAEIAVGFGILFIGLSSMSSSIGAYQDSPIFYQAFKVLGNNPILGILVGAVVTAVIQSSSASVGILQTLAMRGIVNWRSAIFITLGQNIGTCITALLSSVGANKTAKRAAVIHLLFNTMGAVIYGIIMTIFFGIFNDLAMQHITSTQISTFHTIFNISITILLFPFANLLVKISGLIIHEDEPEDDDKEGVEEKVLRHLDPRILETPYFAVENAVKEVVRMGDIATNNLERISKEIMKEEPSQKQIDKVLHNEQVINHLETMITGYLIKISQLALTEKQTKVVNNLFDVITDLERAGDHVENIAEYVQNLKEAKVTLSDHAKAELQEMTSYVKTALNDSVRAVEADDVELAKQAMENEDKVDQMEKKIRKNHIERLKKEACIPEQGMFFLDIVSSLERISDHADNIAEYVCSQNDEKEV
ncbi:Na/Pi cotransporter family protein [Anaerostipes sp. MSJ-23]|uniref:Na/Pi cotransporter family protein n=1 Tax=Anaerostipes sp. MSJ-23 TaxID=2841520 RepID=UPI001C110605|nr:Na/Pi cotransporter family protein [Anaerostipes sp. MSJ-23]MBU5460626.1 Na/Pi cotransporter family protein [Anaerostipes sp. MSJ-23]